MRKTSQDGGDSTSITSGFENEYKKISSGIMRSTRNSLKKRVHSLSHETDDAVIEPLLQKDKEKDIINIASQSAKYLLSKTKTEQRDRDKEKLEFNGNISHTLVKAGSVDRQNPVVANGVQDILNNTAAVIGNTHPSSIVNNSNGSITSAAALPKSLNPKEDKYIGVSTGPLIFTTAKIHADGKTKNLEPVDMTVVPISSTIEANKSRHVFNNDKVQDTQMLKDMGTQKRYVGKVVTSDIKLQDQAVQATATPDIVASTTKEGKQNLSTAGRSRPSTTREKLEKLEVYLAEAENTDVNVTSTNKTESSVEIKCVSTGTGKVCIDVKDTAQKIKEPICKSKDSKDTTIKKELFIDSKKIGDLKSIERRNDKLTDKPVSHDVSIKASVDKNPTIKVDTHITNATKSFTKTTPKLSADLEKKPLIEISPSCAAHQDLKIEPTKQLQRQKKSFDEPRDTNGDKVKPKPSSTLPTPVAGASSKSLSNTEPVTKKELDPDKNSNVSKTVSITAKDIKDNKMTQKANDTSLIPTKTTKVTNVAATAKPIVAAKTSAASTIKQSPSAAASAATGKPATNNAAPIAKTAGKTTGQLINKDGSKDGKLSKA